MKYSIIIPYRDRESHLQMLLPKLYKHFEGKDFEIIVSEQDDDKNFKIACVENIAYKYATGDTLIFHQVDYLPSEDVSYELNGHQVVLPHHRGIFVDQNLQPRAMDDIPAGYRIWRDKIDPNFYGGIIVLSRTAFEQINGYNPMYIGWGNEDEDIRERFKWANIPTHRNEQGTFYILYHTDNHPTEDENARMRDFRNGQEIYRRGFDYRHIGFNNLTADIEIFNAPGLKNTKWIKSKNYKIDGVDHG